MHLMPAHAVLEHETLRSFIKRNPLGILTTAISHPDTPFLQSSHIPFLIDPPTSSDPDDLGSLRGHIAAANPQAKALVAAAQAASDASLGKGSLEQEVLVLFTSPTQGYVTPSFYAKTKPETGKVAPTWDYMAVQAYGRVTVYHSTSKSEETQRFLQKALCDLTDYAEHEVARKEEGKAWEVADAPEAFVNVLKRAIVGVEIRLTRLEGRWKMGQELSEGDWKGVVEGMRALKTSVGEEIANVVEELGKKGR